MTQRDSDFLIWPWTMDEAVGFLIRPRGRSGGGGYQAAG
jgi:hypothetical protein